MKWQYQLMIFLGSCLMDKLHAQNHVLTGRMFEQPGKALPYANVGIRSTIDTSKVFHAQADIFGLYRVDKLPTGRYAVTASFLGYTHKTKDTVYIRPGQELTRLDLEMVATATDLSDH